MVGARFEPRYELGSQLVRTVCRPPPTPADPPAPPPSPTREPVVTKMCLSWGEQVGYSAPVVHSRPRRRAQLEEIATASYGADWEERGQRKLAALAALLPLLFPSAQGQAAGTTDLATTALPSGWARVPRPGLRGILTGVAALVVAVIVAVAANAGGESPGQTTAEAVATTSAQPGTSATPTAEPSASASASPSPSESPSDSASPSASASSSPATPSPGETSTPVSPPTPSTSTPAPEPSTSTPSTPAVGVKSVSVTILRQTSISGATASFDVTTDGPGPVTVVITWFTGDTKGSLGAPEGTQTFQRSGATQYTITLGHTFTGKGCYWGVQASTSPSAANGSSSQQIFIRRCTIS